MNNNPDSRGYYQVLLGLRSLECTKERALELLAPLQTKASMGKLVGEYGHPVPEGRITSVNDLKRCQQVHLNNACFRISQLELKTNYTYNGVKYKLIVVGKVKPIGPKADQLIKSFEDATMDPSFAMRGVANNKLVGDKVIKDYAEIITWDYIGDRETVKAEEDANRFQPGMNGIQDISGNVTIGK